MAGNESVGKITLDLEVTSDLSNQINQLTSKIGEQLKTAIGGIGDISFKDIADNAGKSMEKSMNNSMKNVQKLIENTLNKAITNAISAAKKISIPVEFDMPKNFSMPKMNTRVSTAQPRAPPTSSFNTEVIKAQIDNLTKSLDITNAKIEQQQAKLAGLKESYNMAFNEDRKNALEEQILKTETAINKLVASSDKAGFKLADLDEQLSMVGSAAKQSTVGLNESARSMELLPSFASRAINSIRNLGSAFRSTGSESRNAYSGISGFMRNMLQWGIIFPMVAGGIGTLGSYIGSAFMANAEFNNSLNQIKSNLMVAFMPIYQAVLPALNSLMHALATATAYIVSFISQLFGKTYQQSFNSAKALQNQIGAMNIAQKQAEKTANSLGGVGKSASDSSKATKKAASEIKGALAGFDEINQLQMNKTSTPKVETPKVTTPAGSGVTTPITPMANMAPIEAATAGWANKFRNILANLWKPFQQAWAAEGQNTINAAKHALTGILDLLGAIGRSFYIVWTNGTGERILINLLRILQDILNIIGDIGVTFANAWNKGGIGTQVVQNLANALNNVLSLIDKMLRSIRTVWGQEGPVFANIFMKALDAISGTIENITQKMGWIWDHGGQHAFEGFVKLGLKVGELALFIFTNFVLPFVNWFVNMISPAIAPVLDVIGKLFDKLSEVITWLMGSGKPVLDIIITVLGSFLLAWNGVTLAIKGFYGTIGLITKFKDIASMAFMTLTSPIGIVVLAITGAIAIGVLLYKNWDTIKAKAAIIWDGIKSIFNSFKTWLGNVFATDWSKRFGVLGSVLNVFLSTIKGIWNAIKQVFSGIINFVAGVFTGNWKRAWTGVKQIFSGIMSGLGAVFKTPLNGVIALINGAIKGLNKIHVDIPSWVPEMGGKKFGVNISNIPYLAQGGIVDKPTLSMIGEAGKEAVVPLQKNTGGLKILADMLTSEIGAEIGLPSKVQNNSTSSNSSSDNTQVGNTQLQTAGNYGQNLNAALAKGLADTSNVVAKAVNDINLNITTLMDNLVATFNKDGIALDDNLGSGIEKNDKAVLNPLDNLIKSMTDNLKTFINDCITHGENSDKNFGTGINNNSSNVINAVNSILAKLKSILTAFVNSSVSYGQGIDNSISNGINSKATTVTNMLNNLSNRIKSTLLQMNTACKPYGDGIVVQLANGVNASSSKLTTIVKTLTDKVIQQFRSGFGIHSPSKVMYQIGNYLMQGLVNGMSSKNVSDFISKWIGDITSSAGGAASGNVQGWLTAAMGITGTPMMFLPMLENIAMHESGGNPKSINLWDSNAMAGHPSKGLMQMIDSTFSAHALPGMDDIWNPIDNAVSAIRYMISQYGGIANVPGIRSQMNGGGYVGYYTGTNSAAKGLAMTGELGPEMIDFSGGEMVLNLQDTISLINSAVGAIGNIKNAIASTISQPQLAMIGSSSISDQSSKTNFDELKRAIIEAIKEAKGDNDSGNSTDKDINLNLLVQLGDTPFGKAVIKAINKLQKQAGRTLIKV